jgi:hypothetical protein
MPGNPGKVTVLNTVLTLANTEYPITLPVNTVHLTMQGRGLETINFYFSPGGDSSHYFTIKSGACFYDQGMRANQQVVAFSPSVGAILEIISWSDPS